MLMTAAFLNSWISKCKVQKVGDSWNNLDKIVILLCQPTQTLSNPPAKVHRSGGLAIHRAGDAVPAIHGLDHRQEIPFYPDLPEHLP